jgi:KaiC/GvpD/RAD55 family RecA-like ATPase
VQDLETRTINKILRLTPSELPAFLNNQQITPKLFTKCEREYKFLRSYVSKYGLMPSKAMFSRHYPDLPRFKVRDPLDALIVELKQRAQRNIMVELVNNIGQDEALTDNLEDCLAKLGAATVEAAQFDPVSADFEYVKSFDRRYQSYLDRKNNLNGVRFSTGCEGLDKTLNGGLSAPQLMVLAGDPKLGKTWWLVNMICACVKQGRSPLLISPEMDEMEIMQRIDAMRFQLPHTAILTGTLNKKQEARWKNRVKQDTVPIFISDTTHDTDFTPSKVLGKVEMYKPSIVLIDSAYYMRPDGYDQKHSSYLDNFALIKQLKNICKQKQIPMVCVVQMGRESEKTKLEGEAALRGIYGGDSWAQSCDVLVRLTGARAESFRKLVLLANREGIPFKEHYVKYSFDPYPEIHTVDEVTAEDAELDSGDEVLEVEV